MRFYRPNARMPVAGADRPVRPRPAIAAAHWSHSDASQPALKLNDVQEIYPLVNVYITMENHHF